MSAILNFSKYIKKNGFENFGRAYGISVFLKSVDERFSQGFVVSKHPRSAHPMVAFGIMDWAVSRLLRKIEGTEGIKLCSLTFQSELNFSWADEKDREARFLLAIDNVINEWFFDDLYAVRELLDAYSMVREPAFFRKGMTNPEDSLMPFFSLLAKLVDGESLSSEYVGEFYRRYLQLGFSSRILKYKIGELETYLNSL